MGGVCEGGEEGGVGEDGQSKEVQAKVGWRLIEYYSIENFNLYNQEYTLLIQPRVNYYNYGREYIIHYT